MFSYLTLRSALLINNLNYKCTGLIPTQEIERTDHLMQGAKTRGTVITGTINLKKRENEKERKDEDILLKESEIERGIGDTMKRSDIEAKTEIEKDIVLIAVVPEHSVSLQEIIQLKI